MTDTTDPSTDPSNFVTYAVCLPCDDNEHGSCYGGLCQCTCTKTDSTNPPHATLPLDAVTYVCGARNSTCVCIDAHLSSDTGVTHRCHKCGYHWEVK